MAFEPQARKRLERMVARSDLDDRVVDAFRSLDRADFVPGSERAGAYEDRPVRLPEGQTTSQPTLIAKMVDEAGVGPDDVVLEIGAGYGFQTALLARLAARVVAIERFQELADRARANLATAGIENAEVVVGDGWEGWPQHAPYQAIVVSATADSVPTALVEQLDDPGRLVMPILHGMSEEVVLIEKRSGTLQPPKSITPARFVPLVRGVPR